MKTITIFSSSMITALVAISLFSGCKLDDAPANKPDPTNELSVNYDLPEEIKGIIDADVMKITGSLEPFLDKIQQHNMKIYQGNNPPEIFKGIYNSDSQLVRKEIQSFEIKNDCIYDEYYPSYADSVFGSYLDNIFVDRAGEESTISYSSISNTNPIEFPNGIDQGQSERIITAGDKNNFTIFFKVDNGIHNRISYSALWIYSGTYNKSTTRIDKEVIDTSTLSNITKCMVLLSKGNDPNGVLANIGTIRIFRDSGPIEGI